MTRFRRAAAALGLAIALLGPAWTGASSADAQAQQPPPAASSADCQIFEIKATNEAEGVDPALRDLARKLKKPPFSSWKTFKLLKKHSKRLQKMKALRLPLVTGSKLTLLYRDRSGGGEDKKVRLRLKFTLDDKDDKRMADTTINVDSGDYNLIGADPPMKGGGTYILAVSCRALP